ncbi:TetR family transcriptional regulator [Rhodococcus erythropolis]|uniref:TetR family transcriptional regulator n=1 Tax=Rhodococcus erythropolis TaxID=1833 RepID=A0A0C3ADY8_RHOER|nr:TetR family transcriptional regulator [Rhodococcus erythropolis]KIM17526.1 hypothetical protein QV65_04585 [Rhodococcus erythropolis]
MIESAQRLLSRRGYQATSFSAVLADSEAPRGSIYHHFPDGKDQLIAAAIEQVGAQMRDAILSVSGKSPQQVTKRFLSIWRQLLEVSDYESGCAIVAVTVSAESPELRQLSAAIFRENISVIADALHAGGLRKSDAKEFSYLLVAAVEGAVVLSRAQQSLEPFDIVAAQMRRQARRLTNATVSP